MTFKEFKEINEKYNYSTMFNSKSRAMSKEEYEERVKDLIEIIKDTNNDDSNEGGEL